jgi:hypothetical protein
LFSVHIYNHPLSLLLKSPRQYHFKTQVQINPQTLWKFSSIKASYERQSQLLTLVQKWRLFKEHKMVYFGKYPYQVQIIFQKEFQQLFKKNRFKILEFSSDFKATPFHEQAYSMVITASN